MIQTLHLTTLNFNDILTIILLRFNPTKSDGLLCKIGHRAKSWNDHDKSVKEAALIKDTLKWRAIAVD